MKRVSAWLGANPLRPAFFAIAAILLLGALGSIAASARLDRDWYPYLWRTPDVALSEANFTITPVSDWRYAGIDLVAQEQYGQAAYRFEDLRNVWFVLEPQPGSQLAAHTLLLFEFEGDRLLGLTIEARRETHEEYSALWGLFNAFELAYIWGSARDFLTRRVIMLDHEVFVYPVAITDAQKRDLLRTLLMRTESLETRARYYNTIFSNCTNELAKAAGFDWAPAFVLTGRSDEYLFERRIIPGESFEAAHARSDITAFVATLNQAPPEAFDKALLTELRRRNAMQRR